MGLSGCSRSLSVGLTAATPTSRRAPVVQRLRELSVRRSCLQRPACFNQSRTTIGLHQPRNYAPHGLAGCQALKWDSGSVSDPVDTADDAGQPVDTPTQRPNVVNWKRLLWTALDSDSGPNQFACSGRLEQASLYPDIIVAGVGRLTLPLSRDQGAALKAVAEQAPYGRGPKTVVDTMVRDAYQVDASKVTVAPSWQPTLQSIVSEVAEAFDTAYDGFNDTLACNFDARLYKLLLYEEGGHFLIHQDTEKEPGMLATLVVQLPCCEGHTGGKLTVWHKGNTFNHRFDVGSATSLQYAAFYTDCEHMLSPITSGMRLALVYNLVWVGAPGDVPKPTGSSSARAIPPLEWRAATLQRALRAWEESIAAGCEQTRIAFMLDHQYTRWNLRFNYLKGRDRSKWQNLATLEGLETNLALVTRRIRGNDGCGNHSMIHTPQFDLDSDSDSEIGDDLDSLEPGLANYEDEILVSNLWRNDGCELDPDKWEYVYKDLVTAEKWVAPDGSSADYGNIDQREFYNPDSTNRDSMFTLKYLEQHSGHYNYLGNEGASTIQIYKRAALVLWPQSQTLVNASKAGFRALLPLLEHSLNSAGSGASGARVFAASALEQCVQRLEAELPTGCEVCDKDEGYFEERDSDSTSFFCNYMNEDRTGSYIQDCTLTLLKLSLKAAESCIPTAAEMLQRIAAAVEKRPDNYSLLKRLLECSEVQAALSTPAVQHLVSCQRANLEEMSWIQPFSWHMPEAEFKTWILSSEDNARVDQFLQGPEGTFTLSGFDNLKQAERTAGQLQGYYGHSVYHEEPPSIKHPKHSFTAVAKADSFGACVVITKTKDWYMEQVEAKTLLKEELEGVRAMRR